LKDAIASVDHLQRDSEAAQASFARGEAPDLHDVLIRIEEAEVAFKTMMEVRNKLVDAYREIMRMGV
jgi:flagellar hook-basal body complex protein FliE